MNTVFYIAYLMFFFFMIHLISFKFPIVYTIVKHKRDTETVNYVVFIFGNKIYETEYKMFERKDKVFLASLYFINKFINMNIRVY